MCEVKSRDSVSPKRKRNKTNKIFTGVLCNMLKHLFLCFRKYIEVFLDLIFSFIWDGTKTAIPDLEKRHNILAESAVALASKIRNKELKSEDLVRICIERIKAVNPIINAVSDERFENAIEDAKKVDKVIESGLSDEDYKAKPFLGVPFTAKESHAVAGLLHTLGILRRRHVKAEEDAECVRLLREAGAIPVAVTNVPEINKWQETRNNVFGQTKNPYHTGRTSGGSSGGEAALNAAMAVPISLCSDIGGSTRMPAYYCGLFALNPTSGYTNLKGSSLRSGLEPSMASIGFASRHCEDLAPLTKIVVADKAQELNLDREVNIQDIKFYYLETAQDLRVSPLSSDVRQAMKKVVKKLTEEAKTTEQVPKSYYHRGFDYMFALWKHGMTKEADSFPKMLTDNRGEAKALIELPKKLLGKSEYTLAAILKLLDEQVFPQVNPEWADKLTEELKDDLINVLGEDGVLLLPSAPHVAPYHYSLFLKPFNFAYWAILNALHFPAAQVPLGLNSEGLPLGIQVAAAPKQEALCLAVAKHFERQFGGFVPPCKVY